MKKGRKLGNVILGLTIASIVLALGIQASIFLITSKDQIRKQNISEKEISLKNMQTELSTVIHSINTQMLSIYNDNELTDNLVKCDDSEIRKSLYFWARNSAVSRFGSQQIKALYVYNDEDVLVSNYRYNAKTFVRDIFECDYDNNQEAVKNYLASENNGMLISGYYNKEDKTDVLRFVLKLKEYKEKKDIGYLICEFDSDLFTGIMSKYIWDENVIIWLQPIGDDMVASTSIAQGDEKSNITQITKIVKNYYYQQGLSDEYNKYDLIQVGREDGYNLEAFEIVPQSLVTSTQKTLLRNFLFTSLWMIGLSVIVVSIVTKWLFRPVDEMKESIVRIKNGETQLRVEPVGWSEELEILGHEFNEMLDKTQKMVKDEYEAKLLVERTEYKMLQTQINPHFLYNTLDTMRGIATVQNCPMVSGLCQSLSAIFRYSLNMSDSMSNLQKEIAHVRNYLYVMDVRNGNSIEFEYDIDENTLYNLLPRITIQPIVENAINHGLRNVRRKDKKLIIKTRNIDDNLVISVIDNGTGMDEEQINKDLKENDPKRVERGISVGILNVNARLKNLFGDQYGISVVSQLGGGTTVNITVPNVRDEEEYCYGENV